MLMAEQGLFSLSKAFIHSHIDHVPPLSFFLSFVFSLLVSFLHIIIIHNALVRPVLPCIGRPREPQYTVRGVTGRPEPPFELDQHRCELNQVRFG